MKEPGPSPFREPRPGRTWGASGWEDTEGDDTQLAGHRGAREPLMQDPRPGRTPDDPSIRTQTPEDMGTPDWEEEGSPNQ